MSCAPSIGISPERGSDHGNPGSTERARRRLSSASLSGARQQGTIWIIDGGPKSDTVDARRSRSGKTSCCRASRRSTTTTPLPIALGMVSHIDDDHINGIQKLTSTLVAATRRQPAAVKFDRFWFNSFDKLVGPKPAGSFGGGGHGLAAVACQRSELAGGR